MTMPAVYNMFNRGEVSANSVARDDVTKIINSASLMSNFWPQRLGPMSYRNGLEYKGALTGITYQIPFVKKIDDTATLLFSNDAMRVAIDGEIVSRTSVPASVTNPTFVTDLTGWTVADGVGSSSVWLTGGYASLTGADTTTASIYQTITTTVVEHALRIKILSSPARVRIGTTGADSSDIFDKVLGEGTHSLVFTPSSDITVTISNSNKYRTLIDSVDFEIAGEFALQTGIAEADLGKIRFHQSADVVFIAVDGNRPVRIERQGTTSWSIVEYRANDGPFDVINVSNVTLQAGALSGDTTLTASEGFFTTNDIGSLYRIAPLGQQVDASISAADAGTASIRVTGISGARIFSISVSGTFSATVTLQRSADDVLWEDVESYTGVVSKTYDDGLDNATMYYRLFVKVGNYTSGTAVTSLTYESGSIEGIVRVTGYTSDTVVDIQVLSALGSTDATRDWYRGTWRIGSYPSATTIYEGRTWWAGSNSVWGSVSDAYTSFDRELEGNSASIFRTIGFGPVDAINWLCPTSRLILGLPTEDLSLRSSSFGELLSPLNANIKENSGQGSAPIDYVKAGQAIYFAHHVTTKLIRLIYDINSDSHIDEDLMTLHPEIAAAGIKRLAIVRQPETRIFVVLNDGTALVFLHDRTEDIGSWSRMVTDGLIEDVVSIPAVVEDRVYFTVNRGGERTLERLSLFSENNPHDSHVRYTSPSTTITGLPAHLEGRTVGVWGDGADRGNYEVTSGEITVPEAYTDVTVGLRYTADYTSNKLSNYLPYSPLLRRARVVNIALLASNLYGAGLSVGPDSDNLRLIEGISDMSGSEYDQDSFPFDGSYGTNSRVHIRATAPVTIKALVYGIKEAQHKGTKQE